MLIGRLGEIGSEKPAVFLNEREAVFVDSLINDWSRDSLLNGGFDRVAKSDLNTLPRVKVSDFRVAAPLARPTKIICVGLNYKAHAAETGMPVPDEPIIFMKTPDSFVGPFDDIEIPPGSEKTDYEVELAIVIGKQARYLKREADAKDIILGYTVSQDVSERHWQVERGGQWDKGKGFPTFNPCGPWINTDPNLDPQKLQLICKVDGETRQDSNTDDMIFGVYHTVWYISQFMELFPGDVINTGTPFGVAMGMNPPKFLKPGQVVETTVENIGTIKSKTV